MSLLDLPLEIVQTILLEMLITRNFHGFFRMRQINRFFAEEVLQTVSRSTAIRQNDSIYFLNVPKQLLARILIARCQNCKRADDGMVSAIQHLASAYCCLHGALEHQVIIEAICNAVAYKCDRMLILSKSTTRDKELCPNRSDFLALSACLGNLSALKQLIDKGHNINEEGNMLGYPFCNAARIGDMTICRYILDLPVCTEPENSEMKDCHFEGLARPTVKCNLNKVIPSRFHQLFPVYRLALSAAIVAGHAEIVVLLLDHGEIYAKEEVYQALLELASATGNESIVKSFLERILDLKSMKTSTSKARLLCLRLFVAMQKAAAFGHANIVKLLISSGAEPDYYDKHGADWITSLFDDRGRCTPLRFAARRGNLDAARTLLEAGAKITTEKTDEEIAKGYLQCTRFSDAAWSGDVKMVELFLEYKGDQELGDSGVEALVWASFQGNEEMIRLLVGAGVDVNGLLKSRLISPVLAAMMRTNNERTVDTLVQLGANRIKSKEAEMTLYFSSGVAPANSYSLERWWKRVDRVHMRGY